MRGRSIRTAFADEWHGREDELQRQRETILEEALAEAGGPDLPVRLHDAYAGQSAGLIHDVKPAKQIIEDVVREAETVLAALRSS